MSNTSRPLAKHVLIFKKNNKRISEFGFLKQTLNDDLQTGGFSWTKSHTRPIDNSKPKGPRSGQKTMSGISKTLIAKAIKKAAKQNLTAQMKA